MITIIDSTQGDAFGGATWTETFTNLAGSAPTNGNRIVIAFDATQAPTSVSVGGNSLTQRATRAGGGANNLYIYDSAAITGSPTTFTVNFGSAADGWLLAWEISGVDATTPRDTTFNGTGSGTAASVAFTSGVANVAVLGMWLAVNNGGLTAGSGYTALGTGGNWERWMERASAGAAGSKTFDATLTNSVTWYGLGIAYRPVASGGGGVGGGLASRAAPITSLVGGGLVAAAAHRKTLSLPPRRLIVPHALLLKARMLRNEIRP